MEYMDIEKLIQEISSKRPIWDQKSILHHNRDVVTKCWQEVATACGVKVDIAKAKWKNLRDNFRAECKKINKKRSEDPSRSPAEHQSSWIWFTRLQFLQGQMLPRKVPSNSSKTDADPADQISKDFQLCIQNDHLKEEVELEEERVNIDTVAMGSFPNAQTKSTESRQRNETDADLLDIERKKIKLIESHLSSAKSESHDDSYHFLMSLHKPLSSLPFNRQMFIRYRIQELIYEEISNIQNSTQYAMPVERKIQHPDLQSASSELSQSSITNDGYLISHYE